MKTVHKGWIAAALLFAGASASAAYSCNVSSAGASTVYDDTSTAQKIVQASLTVDCTRAGTDASPMSFTVSQDGGANATGNQSRARLNATNTINYDLHKNATCNSEWRSAGPKKISGSVTFTGFSGSATVNYWTCIPAAQTGKAAGTYTDSVTMTLDYSNSTATSIFPVNISTPPTCAIPTKPTTIAFGTYVALGSVPPAQTTVGVNCTIYLPYTLAVTPAFGVIAGLNYALTVNNTAATVNLTGSGAAQTHTINGTMAAGQAGTCSTGTCSGSNTHTLTLTY